MAQKVKAGFNPVKEEAANSRYKRVVWTTDTLNTAVNALVQGRRLVANPFLDNNVLLLKPELVYQRTEEEKAEWLRCKEDIVYFVEKYAKIMTPKGVSQVKMRPYQVDYLKLLENNRLTILCSARQSGKCNSFDTHILVRTDHPGLGWNQYLIGRSLYYLPIFELYLLDNPGWQWRGEMYRWIYRLGLENHATVTGITGDNSGILRTTSEYRCPGHGWRRWVTNQAIKFLSWLDRRYDQGEKIIDTHDVYDIEVYTPSGWEPITHVHRTRRLDAVHIRTRLHSLTCADNHILMNGRRRIFAKDSAGKVVDTWAGKEVVEEVVRASRRTMFDISVGSDDHVYYTNGILSHNTITSALFMLHYMCFNIDKTAMILGNRRKTAVEILDKCKGIFMQLPYFIKPGIYKWNEGEIVLDNGCRIICDATTETPALGFTVHCMLCDEFAHNKDSLVETFYGNVFPTLQASKGKMMITSTTNGRNLFYRLFMAAKNGESDFAAMEVTWDMVPEWDPDKQEWFQRDEAWKQKQIANLGSLEQFNKQFGTDFDLGANTLISQRKLKEVEAVKFINKDIPGVPIQEYWYWHPDIDPMDIRNEYVVITCDLAEGLLKDYTVFSLFRLIHPGTHDMELIGYFRCNDHTSDNCAESLMYLCTKWLDMNKLLVSFERNTYGSIFLRDINDLSNKEIPQWEQDVMIRYYNDTGTRWDLGVKITSGNKTTHCVLFKATFERGGLIIQDERFMYELQNFCDDGTGHYKASFGHDDMIMTAVQLEFVKSTLQYKIMRDDFDMNYSSGSQDDFWNPYAEL